MSNEMIALVFSVGGSAGFLLLWGLGLAYVHYTSKLQRMRRRFAENRRSRAQRAAARRAQFK